MDRPWGREERGKSSKQMLEEHRAATDAQPLLTSCCECSWRFEGTVGEGRWAAAEHRAAEHPQLRSRRARRLPGKPVIVSLGAPSTVEEQEAALREAEWRRLRANEDTAA